jgi:hypothetical protein
VFRGARAPTHNPVENVVKDAHSEGIVECLR